MAELAGKTNIIYILAGTTAMTDSTGAQILGVDNSTFSQLCDILEVTAFGDEYKSRMAGLKDWTMSISGNYYPGDTNGQDKLVPGDNVFIGVYPQGEDAAGTQGPAIVGNFDISSDVAGKQTFSCSLSGNGAPVTLPAQA